MTKLEQIEQAIAALPHDDIVALADWFAEFHADLWDKEIAADAKAGRLDKLAGRGSCRSLGWPHHTSMKHFTDPAFWKLFNSLPPETQKQAH